MAKARSQLTKKEKKKRTQRDYAERERELKSFIGGYLESVGVEHTLTDHGVTVAGSTYTFTSPDVRSRKQRNRVIDKVVMKLCRQRLLDMTVRQLAGHGFPVKASFGIHGVRLHRDRHVVAVIRATQAKFVGHRPVDGVFLVSGKHWNAVRKALRKLVPKELPRRTAPVAPRADPESPGPVVLTQLPSCASKADRLAATIASDRLRTERSLEFGHPVVLQSGKESVRFAPIDEHARVAEVVFDYRRDAQALRGALRLKTPQGPLALVLTGAGVDDLVADAWLTALSAYAELTCVAQADGDAEGERTERRTDSARGRGQRRPRSLPAAATPSAGGARPALSGALVPTASTRQFLASYVVGHRRLLGRGRRPSEEARRRAQRIGIVLDERETWVRPHARGVPADAELIFDWRRR